ncbi:hypothetical protein HBA54_12565 [Pelagibius litoralis]|uniref:Phosphoenolpyruvate hydrolase-like n=1 Tax=Pelagibius litoralis TaxID=374515 RepID=A0A967EXY6_9PROT|nr:hypothetical protein [Pelagibius litoralis]NIA69425.1 hypothetical protein [Pelagibius litoralis]
MLNLMFWKIVLRSGSEWPGHPLPPALVTIAPPLRSDDLPEEVGLLLPNKDSLAATMRALEAAPETVSGHAVGLFLADPFLNLRLEINRLDRLGVRWVTNLPSTEQQDAEFTQQLKDVGLDCSLEYTRLAACRDAGFGALAVVADGKGAKLAVAAGPTALIVMPRVADFAAGFPSFRQRGAAALEVRRAIDETVWTGPILGLGDKSEAEHEGIWPEAVDGLVCRPVPA